MHGQFSIPQEQIAVDKNDRVYIVDGASNPRVQIFDANGHFITKVGTVGSGDSQLRKPEHVSIDSDGNLFVVDRGKLECKFSLR
jgi:DNA-binding beta-propeller fold protein YncE